MDNKLGKIESICEGSFGDWPSAYDGVIIKTDTTEIKFGINNYQNCCEDWGFISCPESEFSDVIGADVQGIVVVDTNRHCKDIDVESFEAGGAMFVNVETTRGTLQFACYNNHNGYYGHTVRLIVGNLIEAEEGL